jgi:squalene-associated FAD-dependent desaturase
VSRAIVIGGGLAGMAAAVALERAGFQVELFEAHNRLGGRAGSFLPADRDQWMDRGQHILLGCCRNLLDFYRRLGVEDRIRFYDEIVFAEPGGRRSILRAVSESAPARAAAFLGLRFLRLQDKLGIVRALAAVRRDYRRAELLDSMTMADWLRQRRQAPRAIQRFWRPLVVSALNEEPDRVSALHGVQVLGLAFLASRDSARLGVPAVPLVELYAEHHWRRFPKVSFHTGMRVKHVQIEGERVDGIEAGGVMHRADVYILAVPAEAARALVPQLELAPLESSPITGIYLAFDRPVLDLPQSALLDRTIQWAFSKEEGRAAQIVVSASRGLLPLAREEIVRRAVGELAEFFPAVAGARLERSYVTKEVHATFTPRPGLASRRPPAATRFRNLFLAGDWTRTGWPATMEGAVRSGYLAAEAATAALGNPRKFLIPDPSL